MITLKLKSNKNIINNIKRIQNNNSSKHFLNMLKYIRILIFTVLFVFPTLVKAASKPMSGDHVDFNLLLQNLINSNTTTYTWSIESANDWDDLQAFMLHAKIAGITVWVSLLPPSKTPPKDPNGTYSEPFKNDYVTWANEIAKLSLRYSNIESFSIADMRENLSLNYLTQTYINSVESAGSAVNPKLKFDTSLPNSFYVDKDAKGNGNGSNWTNAANKVSGLNWSNIKAGDSIYVSGGTSGQIYFQDSLKNRVYTDGYVTITGAWQRGHNGRVTYRQQLPLTSYIKGSFILTNCQRIKIKNMNFDNQIDGTKSAYAMIHLYGCWDIIIDSDSITSYGNGFGIWVDGTKSRGGRLSVLNCYFEIKYNNLNSKTLSGQDPLFMHSDNGGNTIINNKFVSHSAMGDQHPDIFQMYDVGSSKYYTTTIANNLMILDNKTSTYSQCVYSENDAGNIYNIYNNIVSMNSTSCTPFSIKPVDKKAIHTSLNFNNNTLEINHTDLNTGSCRVFFLKGGVDTLRAYNNIYQFTGVNLNPIPYALGDSLLSEISYIDVDYNHFQFDGANYVLFNGHIESACMISDNHKWSQWQALGYDVHSDTGHVSFSQPFGKNISDYQILNVLNKGKNLSDIFSKDIRGVIRPKTSAWGKGAIE